MTDTPRVAILMAAVSDRDVMQETATPLDRFGVPHDLGVVHSSPDEAFDYAASAAGRGDGRHDRGGLSP